MTLQDLGSVGEFVAAIATIATLVYLATQIRQNTNQLKGEAVISINDAEFALDRELRSNPELFSVTIRAMSDWHSLTPIEQANAHLFLHSHTRWCETSWTLWDRGGLDFDTYESRELFIIGLLSKPEGGSIWWHQWKAIYDPRFAARLDERLAAADPAQSIVQVAPFYQLEHWVKDGNA